MIEAHFKNAFGNFSLDANFTAPATGVTALFGHSGCGKTTVLRCLAGLNRLPDSRLTVNGTVWQEGRRFLPPHRRAIGFVFQEASLFPHLSVRSNLGYGMRRASHVPRRIEFDEVVELLGIGRLFDRPTPLLSGGERQRVAIGRALLSQPDLLLMDEPLSALDRISKDEILPYLEKLHDRLSIPVVYVSHDMAEVERLADTLVLMEKGKVLATGPIADLLTDPALPFSRRPDPAAIVEGTLREYDMRHRLSRIDIAGGQLLVPTPPHAPGGRHRMRILANDVSLSRQPPLDTTILNALPARIAAIEPSGETLMTVHLTTGRSGDGADILSRISRLSWERLSLKSGETVFAQIKAVALAETMDARDGDAARTGT